MIAPMKKVTIVTLSSAASATLAALRDLGIVQVEYLLRPESPEIERLRAENEIVEKATQLLSSRKPDVSDKIEASPADISRQALSLMEEKEEFENRLQSLEREIEELEPLRKVSPTEIADLTRKGLFIRIYKCRKDALAKTAISIPFEILSSEGALRYIVAANDRDFQLPWEELPIPGKSIVQRETEMKDVEREIARIAHQLDSLAARLPSVRRHLTSVKEQLEFAEVLAGMGREEGLSYLRGFLPAEDRDRLMTMGRKMGWAVMIEEPADEDPVPTLIKNPPWIRIIEPVFEFMGTVPGYREYDLSLWFLLALSLFFAMLVSDGGYGLLFLAGTLLARRKLRALPSTPFAVLFVFSAATVLWGLITGTWFGVEGLARLPFLRRFVVADLYSYADNQKFMMHLCFVLGAVHLTIAHGIRMARHLRSLRALSEMGWMMILWFLYFLAATLVLDRPFPSSAIYLFLLGLFLTAAFSNPQRHFVVSFFLTLADLPLNIVRSFSDVISYIRLFAVGYATLVLALSFNQMAANLGWGSAPKALVSTLILLVGHALNMSLAGLAVLVHGVRLNMLEFSGHLEMTWAGRKYAPFRRRTQGGDAQTSLQPEHRKAEHERRREG